MSRQAASTPTLLLTNSTDDVETTSKVPQQKIPPYLNARVLIEMNGKVIAERQLNKQVLTIGCAPTSDIQISSERVTRFHAILHWKSGAWVIEDEESLNGLSCQGQRIDQLALVHGDCIHLDPTIVLQYEELP
ncbi:MAG: hypothetical protein NVSMB49_28940 [Ktedonobacteraceae bacterium]